MTPEFGLRTYQVISQELHNQCRVLVAFLAKSVEFCGIYLSIWFLSLIGSGLTSNGIIKCLLGKMASLIRRVQDFIVENGEVKSQTQADWVGWCKVGLCNFGGVLVSLKGLVCRLLSLVANGEFSKVTVVITLPVIKGQL